MWCWKKEEYECSASDCDHVEVWPLEEGDQLYCKHHSLPSEEREIKTKKIPCWCPLQDPDKLTEAIQNMMSVEEAAHHCPDCGVGGFCLKHDLAFRAFWGVVKRHLTSKSSQPDKAEVCPHCEHPEPCHCLFCMTQVIKKSGG